MAKRVFISAASAEFEEIREDLANGLQKSKIEVDHQGIFPNAAELTLSKLNSHIADSGLVVHIIGSNPGTVASKISVDEFFESNSFDQFLVNMPELKESLGDCRKIAYTQWEALFALHQNIPLIVYVTADAWDKNRIVDDFPQKEHLARICKVKPHPVEFELDSELVGIILPDVYSRINPKVPWLIIALVVVSISTFAYILYQHRLEVRSNRGVILLGSSLAMVGQSELDVYLPVMDRALERAAFPLPTEEGWRADFTAKNREIRSRPENGLLVQKALLKTLSSQMSILDDKQSVDHLEFGYHIAMCRFALTLNRTQLLSEHWRVIESLNSTVSLPRSVKKLADGLSISNGWDNADLVQVSKYLKAINDLMASQ